MPEEIRGQFEDDRIRLGPEALPELFEQGYFGRPKGKGLELSLVEAAYLLDRSRIKILRNEKELDF
ncbi:MAG: tRNA-intron lyase, partial [Methanothrix soehngenii]|nr:tRNA-intron lyase [Methanothrix soehngenii]